jgi:protein-S-isoprenylcysteine O-methyltransferase Ste14
MLSITLLLGSWDGLRGGLILIRMVARRAVLEERGLREELEGYSVYMTRVRYRFVPYLW